MSTLCDFFIADDEAARNYDTSLEFPHGERLLAQRLSILEVEGILSALRAPDTNTEMVREAEAFPGPDHESVIFQLPDDMAPLLAQLADEQLATVAAQCAENTQEELHWEAENFVSLLKDLRLLAARCDGSKQLYFWMGP